MTLLAAPGAAFALDYDATFTFGESDITADPESSENFEVTPAEGDNEAYVTIKKDGSYKFKGNTSAEDNGAHIVVDKGVNATLTFDPCYIRSKSDPALSLKSNSNVTLVGPSAEGIVAKFEDSTTNGENAAVKISKNATCTFVSGNFEVNAKGEMPDKKGTVKQNAIKGGAGTALVFGDLKDESAGPKVTVTAPKGNGISSDGSLTFNKGTFNVGGSEAPVGKDGIKSVPDSGEDGEGTITINGGTFKVYATDDGISAAKKVAIEDLLSGNRGQFTIAANNHAITCAGDVDIFGGKFESVIAGGDGVHADGTATIGNGNSDYPEMTIQSKEVAGAEGIKAAHVVLNGGRVTITAYDDAISGSDADGKTGLIRLKNGTFFLTSKVGDAFDSNGDFVVTGGRALFTASNKDESLIDVLGSFNVEAGQLIGLGFSNQKMWTVTNGTYAAATLAEGATAPYMDDSVSVLKGFDFEHAESILLCPSITDKPTAYFYAGDKIADGDTVYFAAFSDESSMYMPFATATAKTNVGVTALTLDRASLSVTAGASATLKATVKPDNATDKSIDWSTSDDGIATVDANGKVTGITAGTCVVTAKSNSTGQTAQCTVTVTPNTLAMFRLYNPNSGEHFYTSNAGERDAVKAAGWTYEGVGWNAPVDGEPVYRLYNEYGGEHHYCTSANERAALIQAGWKDEGIGWYSDTNHGVKIMRAYNPNAFANNHNFTADANEQNTLVSMGWTDEGVAWYGVR